MIRTTFKQRITLVLSGFLVGLILLEVGLRIGGWLFLSLQERANQASILRNGEFKILCLGESTTALGGAHAYPRQLEEILNQKQDKIKFTVINKGVPATTSRYIAANFDGYIKAYQPDMVVAMMGINDKKDPVGQMEKNFPDQKSWVHNLRVVKLFTLITRHFQQTKSEWQANRFEEKLKKLTSEVETAPSEKKFLLLANLYRAAYQPDQEKKFLEKALALDPKNYSALVTFAMHEKKRGDCQSAIQLFHKALALMPADSSDYVGSLIFMAECYKLTGDYPSAEKAYLTAIAVAKEKGEKPTAAFGTLGDMYLEQGRTEEALKMFEQELIISPEKVFIYGMLAYCYRMKGEFKTAEAVLKSGIALNPDRIEVYRELGTFYSEQKRYKEAEGVFREALTLPESQEPALVKDIYRSLSEIYRQTGQSKKEKEVQKILWNLENHVNALTAQNYQKLYDISARHKIKFVAVQYPGRPLAPLKKMLPGRKDIVFVDNYASFRTKVEQEGFDAYYTDRFAGDFGHCTPKGNRLLAENVARAILAKVLDY